MAVAALRESLQRGDAPSIAAVLRDLAESSTRDVQSFQRENGTAVVLACILTHLKLEELLLPALQVLANVSRAQSQIVLLVREGGVPAVLAAILAHLRHTEVLRAALAVLRNIVADEQSALRLGGQGAYRIVFAVLQTHCVAEELELVRLGAAVLWRMHLARAPADALLHAQTRFGESGGDCTLEDGRDGGGGRRAAADASSSSDDGIATPRSGHGANEPPGLGLVAPFVSFRRGGHAPFIDAVPPAPEPLAEYSHGATHADYVVRSIASEAERLLHPMRTSSSAAPADGRAAPGARTTGGARNASGAPAPPTDGAARVVFEAYPAAGASSHDGARPNSLLFDADFESANLRRAVQVGEHEYDLVLNCDCNTRGHTQWFLFRIRNMRAGVAYKLNLINLMKPDSLFSSGMRPVVYSEKDAERGIGWVRRGSNVCYYQNQYVYTPGSRGKKRGASSTTHSFYTLSFALTLPHAADAVYVSQCYPYTYTMATRHLGSLVERRTSLVRRELLCHTMGGNACELLTITDFSADAAAIAARKVVLISARVHPGESNASWVMQGLLEALTADSEPAAALRQRLVLKVVPMLNPDGVLLGNYRCGLSGTDLNRNWAEPSEERTPTIYHLKRLMRSLAASDQLLLFCDLHGHSRKRNIFTYGCEGSGRTRLRERIFPRLLADCAHFSLPCCSYKVLRSKEATGRVVVNRQLNLVHSFTLEASMCGSDAGPGAGRHFSTADLQEMGAAFVPALLDMADPAQVRANAILLELEAALPAEHSDQEEEAPDGARKARKASRGKPRRRS